jgi:preprotein translocase subunit SecG
MMHSLRASPVFALVVLVTLGVFGLIGLVLFQPDLSAGLLGQEMAGHISGHFRSPHHRVHDLTFSFLIGTAVVGMLAQVRRPSENVAGQLMALIPWVALVLAFTLADRWVPFAPAPILGALTLIAAILHPTRRNFFGSFSVRRVNRVMLALVIIAAVPLLAFASIKIGLQRTATNDHAALGHYGFMAAFSFTVIGVGLLASLRPDGWRLTAWIAGLLPALLALASLVYPDVDSSLGLVWALAAVAWGVGFVAAAELTRHAEGPARRASSESPHPSSTPRWVKVFGIIAIVLVLLFVIVHLTVGALGGHRPGDHSFGDDIPPVTSNGARPAGVNPEASTRRAPHRPF